MKIQDIGGEFGLIARIAKRNSGDSSVLVRNGDDAAVIQMGQSLLAVSTDAFVEGRHFSFQYMQPQHIGAKVIEASSSDIVAMGGKPKYAWLALCLPKDSSAEIIEQIYAGVGQACERLGVVVLGGDTTGGVSELAITCTVMGSIANEEYICTRSGAEPGDLVYVSGPLGAAAAGQKLLAQGVGGHEPLKSIYLEPHCRVDLVEHLAPYATSMIDISDGLASELWHLSQESKCGLVVEADKVPKSIQLEAAVKHLDLSVFELIFAGGEDYELLYTIKASDVSKAIGTQIGVVTSEQRVFLLEQEKRVPLQRMGFDHFK